MNEQRHRINLLQEGFDSAEHEFSRVYDYPHLEVGLIHGIIEKIRCQQYKRGAELFTEIALAEFKRYLDVHVRAGVDASLTCRLTSDILAPIQLKKLFSEHQSLAKSTLNFESKLAYKFARVYPVAVYMMGMKFVLFWNYR